MLGGERPNVAMRFHPQNRVERLDQDRQVDVQIEFERRNAGSLSAVRVTHRNSLSARRRRASIATCESRRPDCGRRGAK
jgi:hypothetical protein